jgi:hypothetical protein
MTKKITRVIGVILVIGIVAGTSAPLWIPLLFAETHPGFTVSQEMEQIFATQYLADAEVNSGLTIQLLSFQGNTTDNPYDTLISYAVWNNTDEPIVFTNGFYDIGVLSPDELSQKWVEVKLSSLIGNDQVLLLPRNEKPDPYSTNMRVLMFSDFDNVDIPESLRFYVSGTGQITGKNYVAFIDVSR